MSGIKLEGVRSEPFISYLKALGLIRIVSSQKDDKASCRWENGCFVLATEMTGEELVRFFLKEYSPTPIANPWNGGSGFNAGEDTTSIDEIMRSDDSRFEEYAYTLKTILKVLGKQESLPAEEMIAPLFEIARKYLGDEWRELLSSQTSQLGDLADLKKSERDSLELLMELTRALPELNDPTTELVLLKKTCEQIEYETDQIDKTKKDEIKVRKNIVKALKKIRTKLNQTIRSDSKSDVISSLRNELPDSAIEWMDAAVQIDEDGDVRAFPILGSGGNEGRLEYGKTFMDDICILLMGDEENSKRMLESSLFDTSVQNLPNVAVGYFNPGRTGGFNQGPGIEKKDFPTNPWDFILAMEGVIVWSGNITRRFKEGSSALSSPFTVHSSGIGYTSASKIDSTNARAEIWTPLWSNAIGYAELRYFISEGRAEVGRNQPRDGLDFADAVSSLSIDRGIEEFIRYGILKRRGDSYVALPLGKFAVRYRSEADLIRETKGLVDRLKTVQNKMGQPSVRMISALTNVEDAMMQVLKNGGPSSMKNVLIEVGKVERMLCAIDPNDDDKPHNPIFGLDVKWLLAADDGSIEFRLAGSLASIGRSGKVGSIRSNLGPVSANGWKWDGSQKCWQGNSFKSRLVNVLRKRIMDAERFGLDHNPLYGALPANSEDISLFIDGKVDLAMVENLLFGMCWVKWEQLSDSPSVRSELFNRWSIPTQEYLVQRFWAVMKLTFLPFEIKLPSGETKVLPSNPMTVSLLQAGRTEEAFRIVTKELFMAGYQKIDPSIARGCESLDIAAALMIPVRMDFPNSIGIKQMLNMDQEG
ncbi:MAG: type I-U CRISPR-associated protein Csx17 [Methanomassiliicoccales archaeon]|jgi:CRISPR-associated protein Csx17